MPATHIGDRSKSSDDLDAVGTGLAKKMAALGQTTQPGLVVRALHELLDGQDEAAKKLRMAMQIHLARVSNARARTPKAINAEKEQLLSTEEAAQLMGCSRPYVAMLIDANKLHGASKSKGGHRKVPKSSVLQWVEANKLNVGSDGNYRKAAADAGMYVLHDEAYVVAAKGKGRSVR